MATTSSRAQGSCLPHPIRSAGLTHVADDLDALDRVVQFRYCIHYVVRMLVFHNHPRWEEGDIRRTQAGGTAGRSAFDRKRSLSGEATIVRPACADRRRYVWNRLRARLCHLARSDRDLLPTLNAMCSLRHRTRHRELDSPARRTACSQRSRRAFPSLTRRAGGSRASPGLTG
jgi:hypothetical protein